MEAVLLVWSLTVAAIVSLLFRWFLTSIWQRKRLPPGPFPLPVIGNLPHLRGMPHRSMADLAKVYGPLMTLKLGSRHTIVVSSAQIAREMLLKHDLTFSLRPIPDVARALDYHKFSMSWLPPAQPWRDLRRFYNNELFTPQKLDANSGLRLKKVRELMEFVGCCSDEGRVVDIGRVAMTTTLNLICNTLFSIDLVGHGDDSLQEFKVLIRGITEQTGRPNISDSFPVLRWIDPQRMRHRQTEYLKKLNILFDGMIEKRRRRNILQGEEEEAGTKDVLDAFLASKFDTKTIRPALQEIFVAGADTSSNTIEWAMAELMRNPDSMEKVKSELVNSIPQGKEVDESDICNLPYMQAVVKETFRMHPTVPLLPREADETVELCGYMVPKHTQVIVNLWAIGRDPNSWPDPNVFKPERFLVQGKDVDFRGRDFELIPFGAGRRICPGLPLATRMVHLTLASLLRSFHWKLPEDKMASDIDMSEKFGMTMSLANPLKIIPIK